MIVFVQFSKKEGVLLSTQKINQVIYSSNNEKRNMFTHTLVDVLPTNLRQMLIVFQSFTGSYF